MGRWIRLLGLQTGQSEQDLGLGQPPAARTQPSRIDQPPTRLMSRAKHKVLLSFLLASCWEWFTIAEEGEVRDREWVGPEGTIGAYVERESSNSLNGYREQPNWIEEDANQEQAAARGGYARRQVVELIQNSADQISRSGTGRIEIRLTDTHLYCADNGAPIDLPGVRALLGSHLSPKHDTAEIGRFGVGFKSVLGVSDRPEVLSRTGSFRFDRERARRRFQILAPETVRHPILRLAEPVDAVECAASDPVLAGLMDWRTNVIRLPLRPDAASG